MTWHFHCTVATCDSPGCQTTQPFKGVRASTHSLEFELERLGWVTQPGSNGNNIHLCPTHAPKLEPPQEPPESVPSVRVQPDPNRPQPEGKVWRVVEKGNPQ